MLPGFHLSGSSTHGCQMAVARFLESCVFGPSGFWTMAPLSCTAKLDLSLLLDCAPTPSTLVQSKERKGSNFAVWQLWQHSVQLRHINQSSLWPFTAIRNRPSQQHREMKAQWGHHSTLKNHHQNGTRSKRHWEKHTRITLPECRVSNWGHVCNSTKMNTL